jgi:YD repeat-containing protein
LARPNAAWTVEDLNDALATEDVLGPHAIPDTAAWRRLVSQSVQRYADPTTGDPLPLGEVGEVVLPYDVRVLAMTTALLGDPAEFPFATGMEVEAGWSDAVRDDALEEGGYVLGTTWVDLTTLEALAEAATDTPEEAEALLLSWWSPPADPIWAPSGTTTYDDAAGFFLPLTQTDPFGTVVTQSYDPFGLRPVGVSVTVEGVAHAVSAVLDAHTLAPVELTDVNDAVTVAAFDPLGRVTKVANLGRAGETVDDLDHPTATFSYTFATFADDTWTPASAHTTTRRVHWMGSETTDFDEAWVYFDGSGRELLSKAKAAPHPSTPSTPRFVGSGRVLLDAKGNPVKQYEPYFSATSDFEPDGGFDGVTPVLSYDPLGRLVRTDFPDGTHATVVRTPWSETHYDRADTLPDIDGYTPDPEEEPDEETLLQAILREFEAGVPGTLATGHPWLDARGNTSVAGVDDFLTVARGKALRRSAGQSWASRNTPTVVHVDPLGRPFLEQRAKTSTAGDTTDVHVTLDLQGRATAISARYVPEGETVRVTQLATTDVFDLLGRSLRHVRRDAQASGGTGGQTWVLPSVDGQPIRTWDSRDQAFRRTFDALRRPRATFVEVGSSGEVCRLFTRYGEWATTPKAARLLGQPWRVYDTAGLVTTLAVDVDNRVTSTSRRFLEAFRGLPDWTSHEDDPDSASEPTWLLDAAGADPEVYTQTATLDIAGRPLHDAVYRDVAAQHERRYAYDAGGQLVSVEVQSPGTSGWRPVVHDVTYNARGQRTKVLAGDDTGDASLETTYSYDADTFRLVRLAVTRLTDDEVLQDIRWVHDAVGNVTFQEDLGTDAVWFDNTTVQPHRKYAYDALDRLIEATGREHQSTFSATGGDTRQTHRPYGLGPKAHAADGGALRSYTQRYEYDDVGNLRVLRHIVGVDITERTYAYTTEVDGSNHNNRLLSTTVGSTTYPLTYDAHGNVTSMSHLPEMAWDAFDRLASVQTTARYPDVGADDEDEDELETPVDHDWFYVYDGAGQRVRKVRAASSSGVLRWEERLYVGPFEVWRKYDGSGDTSVERETLHVQDGDRRVAMVETLTWDGGTEETSPVARWRYQLDDHLGHGVRRGDGDGARDWVGGVPPVRDDGGVEL